MDKAETNNKQEGLFGLGLEVFLILLILFSIYLIAANLSYNQFDSAYSSAGDNFEVFNKTGYLGAYLTDFLFVYFGYIANFVPYVLLFFASYFLIMKRRLQLNIWIFLLRILGFVLLFFGLLLFTSINLSPDPIYVNSAGILGYILLSYLVDIGYQELVGLSIICILLGFVLSSGFTLILLLHRMFSWIFKGNIEDEPLSQKTITNQEVFAFDEALAQDKLHQQNAKDKFTSLLNNEELTQTQQAEFTTKSISLNDEPVIDLTTNLGASESELPTFEFISDPQIQNLAPSLEPKVEPKIDEKIDEQLSIKQDLFIKPEDEPEQEPEIEQIAVNTDNLAEISENSQKSVAVDTALAINSNDLKPSEPKAVDSEPKIEVAKTNPYASYGGSLVHPLLAREKKSEIKIEGELPSVELLSDMKTAPIEVDHAESLEISKRLEAQLNNYHIKAKVKNILTGPVVTRYELELSPGVKASKVTSVDSDLARAMTFPSIRVAEVIPDKPYIGIETPNRKRQMVSLKEVLKSPEFTQAKSPLSMALGKDISGKSIVVDLAKMPHLLVAGSTGSGKSVGINTMILSLLFRVKPDEVQFIMIDPKVVELSIYNGIPHLLTEVVTDMKKAANALKWCVDEMERRYQLLAALRVRNIEGFNAKINEAANMNMPIPNPMYRPKADELPPVLEKLTYIVVIVDEFADLIMVAGKQIEELIARLAQKARAVGIHLILATQRPSVDVITGLIKANIPSRIAFSVTSKINSHSILDQSGAEALLGKGDMLYSEQGSPQLLRVHGAFMTDDDVAVIADNWRARGEPHYIDQIVAEPVDSMDENEELDPLFDKALATMIANKNTSISSLQRSMGIGYNRAAKIVEQMERQGILSAPNYKKERELLVQDQEDF